MEIKSGSERARDIQTMFTHIASRYDLMNRLMTFGQDMRWRREVIRRAGLTAQGRLLDLGTGTGDLARLGHQESHGCQVTAADFTLEMMREGRKETSPAGLDWSAADALNLPFASESFDAVVSGFLLRNVIDVKRSLREQRRVLKPGGRLVALDTTRPRPSLLNPIIHFHLHTVIPTLGRLLAGQPEAYRYLPETTEHFLSAEQLAALMQEAGFRQVGFHLLMAGTIAIHWGDK
jgi:demethylmenaquinone methyltransferase / 2-methoxy-6-polyprenyl-1,4-benzoquinol methylase